jgi:hypothetical protein
MKGNRMPVDLKDLIWSVRGSDQVGGLFAISATSRSVLTGFYVLAGRARVNHIVFQVGGYLLPFSASRSPFLLG